MIRTPCVFRPIDFISPTFTRCSFPRAVIMSTWSSSCTETTDTTLPLRAVVLMSRTPFPPRRCVLYRMPLDSVSESSGAGAAEASSSTSGVPAPKGVLLPYPFSHTVRSVADGSATTIPTRLSSFPSLIPRTPLVSRPIGRASDSGNRIAIPEAVAKTSSSPGFVITAPTSSSPSFNFTAIRPLVRRRRYCSRGVFFTVPLRAASRRHWSGSSKPETARHSATRSPSSNSNKFTRFRPFESSASSGNSKTRIENTLPRVVNTSSQSCVLATKKCSTGSDSSTRAPVRPLPPLRWALYVSAAVRFT